MQFIVYSLVLSVIFLAALWGVGWTKNANGWAVFLGVATLGLGCLLFAPGLLVQVLITIPVAIAGCFFRFKPWVVMSAAVVGLLAGHGLMWQNVIGEVAHLHQLREEYPLVSLANRLSYEVQNNAARSPAEPAAESPPLDPAVEERLQKVEYRMCSNMRQSTLERLHDLEYEKFISTQGFGVRRMMPVTRHYIELDPVPLVPAPGNVPYESPLPRKEVQLAAIQPDNEGLYWMHQEGLESFLEMERMGFVQVRQLVAGFEPHAFAHSPDALGVEQVDQGHEPRKQKWLIARLELISLLKHAAPVAYVSKNLPNMDELKAAPTRPLSEFERQAVEQLRGKEDLVVQEQTYFIRMVGSVRAGKDCLQCHTARRGDLLGAFTYELTPE